MGPSGPCGGCTEIHVDNLPSFSSKNRSQHVNQDLSDLTELWNLVFIEYFRQDLSVFFGYFSLIYKYFVYRHSDGRITKLPQQHVDTGMGFERLVAFLQNKSSNYDSDLFVPIFDLIQNVSRNLMSTCS